MKEYFKRTLQSAVLIWTTLVVEIVVTCFLYASLNAVGVSENTSLLIAFFTLVGLIIVGLLLFPRSILSLKKESRASVLKWPLQIRMLRRHIKQRQSELVDRSQPSDSIQKSNPMRQPGYPLPQQGYMPPHNYGYPQQHPPMYSPQGVNVTVVNNASTKNNAPVIIEILLSLFGIYGVGWLMAGETTTGIVLLICSFVVYWPSLIAIAVFTIGFGLFCDFPLVIAAIIGNAILLNRTLARKASQTIKTPIVQVANKEEKNLS